VVQITMWLVFTHVASSGKCNVTVSGVRPSVHLSVCLSRLHTRRDSPGAACDAASIHFGPTTRRTDILVLVVQCITVL